jgi:bacteriorhodopsin
MLHLSVQRTISGHYLPTAGITYGQRALLTDSGNYLPTAGITYRQFTLQTYLWFFFNFCGDFVQMVRFVETRSTEDKYYTFVKTVILCLSIFMYFTFYLTTFSVTDII